MATAAATIGHNNPPEPTPFESFDAHLSGLHEEAKLWLDGSGVQSEADAEGVSKLLDMLRTAAKDADRARAAEKKPHDDAAKAVQARWKPLLDRADLAASVCKQVLAPFLRKQEDEKRAAAEAARREAEEKAAAARAAIQAADLTDLAAREEAERLLKDASKADVAANRAEKDRAQAKGGARAVSLRSIWTPVLADSVAALKHYRATRPDELKDFLLIQAERDVRAGERDIPGFTITEERVAV
jgi:hypothetical protein